MATRDIDTLKDTRRQLLRQVAAITNFVRGSVVLMKRRCTYPRCRKCAAGKGHPTWVLTQSRQGKTHTVYLGAGRLAAAQEMAANYQRLMAVIEQVAQVNLELLRCRGSTSKGEPHGRIGRRP